MTRVHAEKLLQRMAKKAKLEEANRELAKWADLQPEQWKSGREAGLAWASDEADLNRLRTLCDWAARSGMAFTLDSCSRCDCQSFDLYDAIHGAADRGPSAAMLRLHQRSAFSEALGRNYTSRAFQRGFVSGALEVLAEAEGLIAAEHAG